MTKKKPRYESRVFDGRIIHSADIERIHKEVLDFKRIEAISEPMRELIEDLWAGAGRANCRRGRTDSPMMTGAQFEIRIDQTPRTYRDRKDFAMEAASLLKSRNPHSVVEVRDLKSGEVTAVAYKEAG